MPYKAIEENSCMGFMGSGELLSNLDSTNTMLTGKPQNNSDIGWCAHTCTHAQTHTHMHTHKIHPPKTK